MVLLLNYVLPLFNAVLNVIAAVIAFVWASLVYVVVGGDYWQLYTQMYNAISTLNTALYNTVVWILTNAPILLQIFFTYAVAWIFVYIKKLYVKACGYKQRAEQLQATQDALENPINVVQQFIIKVKEVFLRWA